MEATRRIENVKEKRDSNFELLRIFSIILIILHHYCVHSGFNNNVNIDNINFNFIFTQLMSFGRFANHIFIIITGYFMVKHKCNYKKIIALILQWVFYSVLIYIFFSALKIIQFDMKEFIKCFVPFFTENWFLRNYIILYLAIPFLNLIIERFSNIKLKNTILILLFLFIGIAICINGKYGITNIIFFFLDYLIGAYIALYDKKNFLNQKKNIIVTTVFFVLEIISVILLIILGIVLKNDLLLKNSNYFLVETHSILSIGLAICIFLVFRNIKIKNNKVLNYIATSVLGIYLIHDNSQIKSYLWKDNIYFFNSNFYACHMIIKVLFVFIVCLIIDKIRILLFEKIENSISIKIYELCFKLYNYIVKIKEKIWKREVE